MVTAHFSALVNDRMPAISQKVKAAGDKSLRLNHLHWLYNAYI